MTGEQASRVFVRSMTLNRADVFIRPVSDVTMTRLSPRHPSILSSSRGVVAGWDV